MKKTISAPTQMQAINAEAAEAIRIFLRLQAARELANIQPVAEIKLYAKIQEFKLFKHLPIKHKNGISAVAENFQEFCDLTHQQGYRGVMEEIQYLHVLGQPTYEALKDIGLERKYFRSILKLPEDARQKLLGCESADLSDLYVLRNRIEALVKEIK